MKRMGVRRRGIDMSKGPETQSGAQTQKSRTNELLAAFFGLSGVKIIANGAVERFDPNVLSPGGTLMSGYDIVLGVAAKAAMRLDRRGRELAASVTRTVSALGHVGVALVGAGVAVERVKLGETGTAAGLGASAVTAIIGGWAIRREAKAHKADQAAGVFLPNDPNHGFAHNLILSGTAESALSLGGAVGQLATANPHFAEAGIIGTAAAVSVLMGRQIIEHELPIFKGRRQQDARSS